MKRSTLRKLRIEAISAVDRPAQGGATVRILKRAGNDERIEKRAILTTESDGHQHTITPDWGQGPMTSGNTSTEKSATEATGDSYGHCHPWVVGVNGELIIGMAAGHTHQVETISKREFSAEDREKLAESGEAMSDGGFPITTTADLKNAISAFGRADDKAAVAKHIKRRATALEATDLLPEEGELADLMKSAATGEQGGDPMPGAQKKELSVEERLAKLEADNGRLTKERALTDVEKSYYDGLGDDKSKETFLGKSADERKGILEKVAKDKGDEEVVYKSRDGQVFKKGDDDRVVAMAKRNDEQAVEIAKLRKDNEEAVLRKRADDELGHMAGTTEERMELLKAVDSIEDEAVRNRQLEILKSVDGALAASFIAKGHASGKVEDGPEQEIDAIAKKLQSDDPKLTKEQAYVKALDTPEGQEIQKRMV